MGKKNQVICTTDNENDEFNFAIVDLPGFNTANHKVEDYFINNYLFLLDILIIVINQDLSNSSIQILKEALTYEKYQERIIIVRNKVDDSAASEVKRQFSKFNEIITLKKATREVIEKTKTDIRKKLEDNLEIIYPIPIFTICTDRLNEELHPGYLEENISTLRGGIDSIPEAEEKELILEVLNMISTSRYN